MLIWVNFEISKVFAKVDEDNLNNKILSFGAKFAVITLEEQGWSYEKEEKVCSRSFQNIQELWKVLEGIEVPKVGILEIISKSKK